LGPFRLKHTADPVSESLCFLAPEMENIPTGSRGYKIWFN